MPADIIGQVVSTFTPNFSGNTFKAVLYTGLGLLALLLAAVDYKTGGVFTRFLYPFKIVIRKRIGGGYNTVLTDGTKIVEDGIEKLYVVLTKRKYPLPPSNLLYPARGVGMFKRALIYMRMDENGDLQTEPCPDDKQFSDKLVLRQQDLYSWGQTERKRLNASYNTDFMARYGVLIGEGIVVFALIIIVFLMMNKFVEANSVLAGAIDRATTVLNAMNR